LTASFPLTPSPKAEKTHSQQCGLLPMFLPPRTCALKTPSATPSPSTLRMLRARVGVSALRSAASSQMLLSATRPPLGGPWLCAPASRRVCLYRRQEYDSQVEVGASPIWARFGTFLANFRDMALPRSKRARTTGERARPPRDIMWKLARGSPSRGSRGWTGGAQASEGPGPVRTVPARRRW
jgi:hypothetical protein